MPFTWAEGVRPTPDALTEWFMSLTSQDKIKWMTRTQECMSRTLDCMSMDHQGRIANLESALQTAGLLINTLQDSLNETS